MKARNLLMIAAAVIALLIAGCTSNAEPTQTAQQQTPPPFVPEAASRSETNVTIRALDSAIVDWRGRMANNPAIPEWVQDLALDYFDEAARKLGQQAGGTGANIYRGFPMTGADLRGAEMRADAYFARLVAKELQTSVNTYLVESSNSNISDATKEHIKEITQTRSEVTFSGQRLIGEHWQIVDTKDGNRTTRQTILYRLYSVSAQDWARLAGAYMQMILNQLPVGQSVEEREVTEMLQYMLNQSRQRDGLTLQERQAELDAQQRMIDAQINMMPQQQRAAAATELARIQAETDRSNVQAVTASAAEMAAYGSANPALRSAASTTVADAPLVDAAKLALGLIF